MVLPVNGMKVRLIFRLQSSSSWTRGSQCLVPARLAFYIANLLAVEAEPATAAAVSSVREKAVGLHQLVVCTVEQRIDLV